MAVATAVTQPPDADEDADAVVDAAALDHVWSQQAELPYVIQRRILRLRNGAPIEEADDADVPAPALLNSVLNGRV